MRMFVAIEQGEGKMSESVLLMVLPKDKVAEKNWMSTVHGREVKEKDKIEQMTTFAPHECPAKSECA